MVFIGVDLVQVDKMALQRVKSAPVEIELNRHFGAETDLLDLECNILCYYFDVLCSAQGSILFFKRFHPCPSFEK